MSRCPEGSGLCFRVCESPASNADSAASMMPVDTGGGGFVEFQIGSGGASIGRLRTPPCGGPFEPEQVKTCEGRNEYV